MKIRHSNEQHIKQPRRTKTEEPAVKLLGLPWLIQHVSTQTNQSHPQNRPTKPSIIQPNQNNHTHRTDYLGFQVPPLLIYMMAKTTYASGPAHTSVEIDHEIFSTAIFSPTDSRRAVYITGKVRALNTGYR